MKKRNSKYQQESKLFNILFLLMFLSVECLQSVICIYSALFLDFSENWKIFFKSLIYEILN